MSLVVVGDGEGVGDDGSSLRPRPRPRPGDFFAAFFEVFFGMTVMSHLHVLASEWQGIKMYVKRWRTLNY